MPGIEELGQLWKQQYPGRFDDRTDREIGLELKMKYPSRFLEYRDEAMVIKASTAIEPEVVPPSLSGIESLSLISKSPNSIKKRDDGLEAILREIANVDMPLYSSIKDDFKVRRLVEAMVRYYEPNRGRFTSWWHRGKAEGSAPSPVRQRRKDLRAGHYSYWRIKRSNSALSIRLPKKQFVKY